jgi:hypothetical protein
LVTALATVAIAILTYFVAVYANGQLKVFGAQLEEMKSTGRQTDNLIEANQKLADAAVKQAAAVGAQLSVMQGQLDEMKAEQRPWVYADIGIGGKAYKTQSNGIGFPIGFMFHNTGHMPAFYVSADIEGYLSGGDNQSAVTSVRDRQKRRCDPPLQQSAASDQIGVTVFPGQAVPFGASIAISETEIDNVKKLSAGLPITPLSPWGVGCIRYRTPDGIGHQTGVAFTIGMIKPGVDGQFVLPSDPTTIDPRQLIIMPWIEGGIAYAN